MPRLAQLETHLSVHDGPRCEWEVLGFSLKEALNSTYEAELEIATHELDVDTGALLGATCELALQRGEHPPRLVYGVIARVDFLGSADHALAARIAVVPALALARQRQHSRIWQQRTVQDILAEVLSASFEPYGRTLELGHLQRGLEPRDYCVQYRESDLDFVCRLLEEEGISWYFVHDGARGHEVLTLCDDNQDYAKLGNVDASGLLPLIAHNPEEADLESVQSFVWTRKLTPTSVALSEYDPSAAGSVSSEGAPDEDARGHVRTFYEHSSRRLDTGALGDRVSDLAEALRAAGSLATAESNAALACVGQRFVLEGVEHEGAPSEWIILSIAHGYGRLAGEGSLERSRDYANLIECAPAEVELRPCVYTPKPQIIGAQTATVVGGGEIDVDSQGRIQVQFHWQEDPSFGAGASCRVRCAQSWAGAGWGAQFIPRVGMEVVVEFLDGNPDRPLVTGCVYNGAHEPPFALPGRSTQSGWRSNSSPGGGGSNELRFEDAAGGEEIYLHGQRDWTTEIKRNKTQTIGHDASSSVGNNRSERVGANERVAIGASQSLSVGADQAVSVAKDASASVGANQSLSVGGDQAISVGANHSEVIAASASQTVALAKTVTVGGMLATIVGGAMNTSVGAACLEEIGGIKTVSVGASSSESVGGPKSVDAATISHSAGKDMSLSAGASVSVSAGKDMSLGATGELAITGGAKGLIELEEALTIKVGKASITLEKNGNIVLEGVKISVKGKKSITLKAKKIQQN